MTFTDDDLKQLKEWLYKFDDSDTFYCHRELIIALLARLEAAELGAEQFAIEHPDSAIVRNWFERMGRNYKTWRKAAGK